MEWLLKTFDHFGGAVVEPVLFIHVLGGKAGGPLDVAKGLLVLPELLLTNRHPVEHFGMALRRGLLGLVKGLDRHRPPTFRQLPVLGPVRQQLDERKGLQGIGMEFSQHPLPQGECFLSKTERRDPITLARQGKGRTVLVLRDLQPVRTKHLDLGGDPLAHARITVIGQAVRIMDDGDRAAVRARYLARNPKAKLYVDFADFSFWRLAVERAAYNAGFGKAFAMNAEDLTG